MPITIVIADDHEIFRDGFAFMMSKQPEFLLIGEASNGDELVSIVEQKQPDVVLTDIKMPGKDGVEATRIITSKFPNIQVIALTMFNEEDIIVDMLEAGAKGYLIKNSDKKEIFEAIKSVANNNPYYCRSTSTKLAMMIAKSRFNPNRPVTKSQFTERELGLIKLICEGYTNKEMAAYFNLSIRTIESYRERIQEKANAKNTAGIIIYAIKNELYKV